MSAERSQSNTPQTLGDLEVGDSATIESVRCARATAVRLMEMGLSRGTRVEVRRVAPLGDPFELFVSGYSLSIRRADALGIAVRAVVSAKRAPVRHESDASDVDDGEGMTAARAEPQPRAGR